MISAPSLQRAVLVSAGILLLYFIASCSAVSSDKAQSSTLNGVGALGTSSSGTKVPGGGPLGTRTPVGDADFVPEFNRLSGNVQPLNEVDAPVGVVTFDHTVAISRDDRCGAFAVSFALAQHDARTNGADSALMTTLLAPTAPPGLGSFLVHERAVQRNIGTGRHLDAGAELWGRMSPQAGAADSYELVGRATAPKLGAKAWVVLRVDTLRVSGRCQITMFASRASPISSDHDILTSDEREVILPGNGWSRVPWR